MSYVSIDPIINAWATTCGLVISKEDTGVQRRFTHTSSQAGETFQVVIEPERNAAVRIDAHLIETWDEEEAHYIWEVPIRNLKSTLDLCSANIKLWFDRGSLG